MDPSFTPGGPWDRDTAPGPPNQLRREQCAKPMSINLHFGKTKSSVSGAWMSGGKAAARGQLQAPAGSHARLAPRAGVGPDLGGSLGHQRVSGHGGSRPTLMFNGVESLPSETEEKRPSRVGHERRWAVP